MSATTSATTGRRYGLKRVCRTWERSRSALYARRARLQRPARGARPARRGPTPALSDAQLLAAIRSDLARSPFQGEGHRKVHARLRILDNIRVSRTRVLRVMRAQGLLSPHRGQQGDPKAHDGTIVTSAPCVMWGTDGVRVFTAEDGWVWTFAAVDHWNAECVGWHVCKVGSRFAALEPIAQGLGRLYGSVEADVARGLARRMDHGSQYLSDHFLSFGTGASTPASASLKSPKPTASSSAGIARSRSKPSTAGSFETSPRCAPPSLRSSTATTSAGASKSWRIARRSKRASNTSYAMPRSANVCPRNRVRYIDNTAPTALTESPISESVRRTKWFQTSRECAPLLKNSCSGSKRSLHNSRRLLPRCGRARRHRLLSKSISPPHERNSNPCVLRHSKRPRAVPTLPTYGPCLPSSKSWML